MHYLETQAAALGWRLTQRQLDQFARYQELLVEWGERFNLTSIQEPLRIQQRHFLDSLSCIALTGDLSGQKVVDVGSGAGFPGLPLKIYYPDTHLTLVESVKKKTRFLRAVVAELGLESVLVENRRAEELGRHRDHRGQYDWALARGVAALRVLVEYLLPLCQIGGHVLVQKGEHAAAETADASNAIAVLGGAHPHHHALQLPGREAPHYLVAIEKVRECPDRYPRRTGVPAKRPL
jgi:16S rRNA (guanine527-N7)-methyltransferase